MLFGDPAAKTAAVSIALDQTQYVAGDLVCGSVRITAKERLECIAITVVASGLETVNWNHDPEPTLVRTKQHTCFTQEIMVSPAECVFERGEHACNFECVLPLVLPGSYALPASYDSAGVVKYTSASIEYKFDATMEFFSLEGDAVEPAAEGSPRARSIHSSQGFTVHESHPELVVTPREDEILNARIRSWCCLWQGRCDFKASILGDVYHQGERVEVVCDVRNDSPTTIPAITCRLIQQITLRLRNHEHVVEREVGAWMYRAVAPHELMSRPQIFHIESTAGPGSEGLLFPSTTFGTLVQARYVIQVEAFIARGPDLALRLPITVLSAQHNEAIRESSI